MIGPPGSGKSTYVQYKKRVLKERSIFTINLDPGNNQDNFDYDIKQFSNTRSYMEQNNVGPNFSTKCLLKNFLSNYDSFINILRENEDKYFIFDFPGQLEFFMCDDSLRYLTRKLLKEGFHLVVVHMIDLVFFIEEHCLLSTYLFCTISMILLELPHVCVISKCDNLEKFVNVNLKDIVNLKVPLFDAGTFYDNIKTLVENEALLSFEIHDYENVSAMMYLQMIIDKASGYLFNEMPAYETIDKESMLERYNATYNSNTNEKVDENLNTTTESINNAEETNTTEKDEAYINNKYDTSSNINKSTCNTDVVKDTSSKNISASNTDEAKDTNNQMDTNVSGNGNKTENKLKKDASNTSEANKNID